MNWTYTDATETVVYRINDDGSMQSMLVSSPEFQAWLEAGGVPDPYLPPELVPPTPTNEQAILYDHENRLRAQEGQPPLSLQEFLGRL